MPKLGLLAAAPVRWLIESETDLRQSIQRFINGNGDDYADVAGPPSMVDLLLYRANPKQNKLRLPMIRLRFRRVKREISGEDGISVTCRDDELEMIEQWRKQALARRAFAASSPRDMAEREHG